MDFFNTQMLHGIGIFLWYVAKYTSPMDPSWDRKVPESQNVKQRIEGVSPSSSEMDGISCYFDQFPSRIGEYAD